MSNIIKSVILGIVILIPAIVFAKTVVKEESFKNGISGEKMVIEADRSKLSVVVITFKTEAEEKIEKNNKKRLDIYKKRLENSRFTQGERRILVTGYSSTPDQCWGDPFQTASGTRVHQGTMACPAQYPFGAKIKIEGLGTFVCEDRGSAIKGNHFDMWFTSRKKALAWGKRTVKAEIVK